MGSNIEISIGDMTIQGTLNDTATASALEKILPVTVHMARWGDEYYGEIPTEVPLAENAREIMKIGEMAFWPPGRALCFFFGRTPASSDHRPRAAGKVNPVGMITRTPELLASFGSSITAQIKKVK
ncbi:MAG: hypothetical protein JW904_02545 [Spirochaetales bacterium]|nr:hypothetical protein [Spirochaetales bacterium]